MGGFKDCFEEYGADYQATMNRFMNNEAFYLRLLNMLFADDTMEQLGNALEDGDKDDAFQAAHTLKGVVGNLGLTPFYDTLCKILEPLRAGEERDDYPALYEAVCTEYQRAEVFRESLRGGRQN